MTAEPEQSRSSRISPPGLVGLVAALVIGCAAITYAIAASSGSGGSSPNSLTLSGDDPLTVAHYVNTSRHPLIGLDHWHAAYAIYVGDERQPNAPTWESGIHTHGDGIIHMHPFNSFEEGAGAALNKWFEYGGGELTDTTVREPGESITYHDGDPVPRDGRPGQVYVILGGTNGAADGLDLSGQWIRVPPNYRPQDGDQIRILFEPEEVMREHIKNPPGTATTTPSPACTTTSIAGGSQPFCNVTAPATLPTP